MTTTPLYCWYIIGATSSLAKSFARLQAEAGHKLVLIARNTAELEAAANDLILRGAGGVDILPLDITHPDASATLLHHAQQQQRPIALYSAAGIMPPEETMRQESALCGQMIAANYTGIVLLCNALLPLFQAQQCGQIILISSVAGDRGRKKNYLYGSSKAGLSAFAQGLAAHLSAYHVPVTLIKPGVMDTAMTWGLPRPPFPLGQPDALAVATIKKAKHGGTLYFPFFWWGIMMMIKHLPTKIFNKLNF